jgi:Phytanoyl-CoA dioxygenase (PhyH)
MTENVVGWRDVLGIDGVVKIRSPFSAGTLDRWNRALDPLFRQRQGEVRSYVRADELDRLGILDEFFQPKIRGLIVEAIPDAVLFHCHAYEITPGRARSHFRGWERRGWHRDLPASHPDRHAPDFLSLFLYLSDVDTPQAPFEVVRGSFDEGPRAERPCIRITGPRGTFFVWNRALLHRAAPNRGPGRRRILKLSIQHNRGPNPSVESAPFRRVRERAGEDPFLRQLFGSRDRPSTLLPVPAPSHGGGLEPEPLAENAMLELGPLDKAVGRLLDIVRGALAPFRSPTPY